MNDEGKIKLADRAPIYCSSCFNQAPDQRHVDFGAYWDGPVLEPRNTQAGVEQVQIDDLVICEDCIKRAAALLGLVNAPDLVAENDELKRENTRVKKRNTDLAIAGRRAVESLEVMTSQQAASREHIDDARRIKNRSEREIDRAEVPVAG